MTSFVRKWLKNACCRNDEVMTDDECESLLKLLAESPEKLWGPPLTNDDGRLFSAIEGDDVYTFLYALSPHTGVGKYAGTLTLPNGRMVIFLFDWGPKGLGKWLKSARVNVDIQLSEGARQQYVTFFWSNRRGFVVESAGATRHLRRVAKTRYGWYARVAGFTRLRRMCFTQMFPRSLVWRLRELSKE